MYQVFDKPWADGRLRFLQVRRSGRVIFGFVYDASVSVVVRLVRDMLPLVASAFGLSLDHFPEVRDERPGSDRG